MNDVNILSIALATATPALIGLIYYHKCVFGWVWKDTVGITDNKRNRAIGLLMSLIISFLMSMFLLSFNNDGINQEAEFDTFAHGAWHGTFIAIAVVTPVIVINGFFAQWSWKGVVINIVYWIITLALMGGIVDAMNHWENIPMPGG